MEPQPTFRIMTRLATRPHGRGSKSAGVADDRRGLNSSIVSRRHPVRTPPGAQPPKSGDTDVDAILAGRVDASIVYCSGRDRYARLLPDATLVQFPADLQIGPEYGLAVLKDAHPAASLLALAILSPEGQRIMAQRGFRPITLPSE